MAATTSVYGQYNTPINTIEHTAVASWSGFVYQGLCALYHSLVLLQRNWDAAKCKYLSLEAYEDFAILDGQGKIESFHQCKCYQKETDFTDECHKMADKEDYWRNKKNMLSASYDKMYFHSNQDVTLADGVQAYEFAPGITKCNPFEIYARIEILVQEVLAMRRLPGSSNAKTAKLITIISEHVSYIHKESIDNPGRSFDTAANTPIPLTAFVKILESPQEEYTKDERIETCRHFLIMALFDRLKKARNVDYERMDEFIIMVESLSHIEFQNFARRIYPDFDILASDLNVAEISNKTRVNYLFNVVNKVIDTLNDATLDWKDDMGQRLSPSTIGKDKDPEEYCADIVNNPYSADLRRDYRWIVGDIDHVVDDIEEGAKIITQAAPTDYTDVTQTSKIGLMDIDTKNK